MTPSAIDAVGRLERVRLAAPATGQVELVAFYRDVLGLGARPVEPDVVAIAIGESTLEFAAQDGHPFFHLALLVPGDRFAALLSWARGRVDLLPDPERGQVVFEFEHWDAQACYFHDPAGNIVEFIAHRGLAATGATGAFRPEELLGISEIGIVADRAAIAHELSAVLGLAVWSGAVDQPGRLAFVGQKARTLILCDEGRGWLPTGRPARAFPVEVDIVLGTRGDVPLPAGGRIRGVPAEGRREAV